MVLLIRLLKIFLIGIAIFFLYRYLKKTNSKGQSSGMNKRSTINKEIEEMKKDPICGTFVPPSQAIALNQNGETVYFCSEACKIKFQQLHQKNP